MCAQRLVPRPEAEEADTKTMLSWKIKILSSKIKWHCSRTDSVGICQHQEGSSRTPTVTNHSNTWPLAYRGHDMKNYRLRNVTVTVFPRELQGAALVIKTNCWRQLARRTSTAIPNWSFVNKIILIDPVSKSILLFPAI